MNLNQQEFEASFYARNPAGSVEALKKATIGIAGAGGLGSNIAVSLIRAGITKLIIADFDRIEMSNLNRQQYFYDQVGSIKVEALKENLIKINPYAEITTHFTKIGVENIKEIFGSADIMVEAFDRAEMKAMLATAWMSKYPDRYMIMASGLSSYGKSNEIKTQISGKLIICGDQTTEPEQGLIAPRVAIVANHEANAVIEIILNGGLSQ